MKAIRHIIRGCGHLPHCGSHPGTVFLWFFAAMGAAAGARGGVLGVIFGTGAMLLFVGPFYLYGAYHRSVVDAQIRRRARRQNPSR